MRHTNTEQSRSAQNLGQFCAAQYRLHVERNRFRTHSVSAQKVSSITLCHHHPFISKLPCFLPSHNIHTTTSTTPSWTSHCLQLPPHHHRHRPTFFTFSQQIFVPSAPRSAPPTPRTLWWSPLNIFRFTLSPKPQQWHNLILHDFSAWLEKVRHDPNACDEILVEFLSRNYIHICRFHQWTYISRACDLCSLKMNPLHKYFDNIKFWRIDMQFVRQKYHFLENTLTEIWLWNELWIPLNMQLINSKFLSCTSICKYCKNDIRNQGACLTVLWVLISRVIK